MDSPWFYRVSARSTARVRVCCFPFAGGGSQAYRVWHKGLDPAIELVTVCLPGREIRIDERPIRSMDGLPDEFFDSLKELSDLPLVLYGHSAGAKMAFAVARRLLGMGVYGIAGLIVSGCNPPHLISPLNSPLSGLDEPTFLRALKMLGGIPDPLLSQPEFLRMLLDPVRADIELAESYSVAGELHLACPITAIRGSNDFHTSRSAMHRWRELTSGQFSFHEVPGQHFFPVAQPESVLSIMHASLKAGGLLECGP